MVPEPVHPAIIDRAACGAAQRSGAEHGNIPDTEIPCLARPPVHLRWGPEDSGVLVATTDGCGGIQEAEMAAYLARYAGTDTRRRRLGPWPAIVRCVVDLHITPIAGRPPGAAWSRAAQPGAAPGCGSSPAAAAMVRRAVTTGSCWSGGSAPSNGANSSRRRRVTSRAGLRQARPFARIPTAWRLALRNQTCNRLAGLLVAAFVPVWYLPA